VLVIFGLMRPCCYYLLLLESLDFVTWQYCIRRRCFQIFNTQRTVYLYLLCIATIIPYCPRILVFEYNIIDYWMTHVCTYRIQTLNHTAVGRRVHILSGIVWLLDGIIILWPALPSQETSQNLFDIFYNCITFRISIRV